jgi:hypothetical protein
VCVCVCVCDCVRVCVCVCVTVCVTVLYLKICACMMNIQWVCACVARTALPSSLRQTDDTIHNRPHRSAVGVCLVTSVQFRVVRLKAHISLVMARKDTMPPCTRSVSFTIAAACRYRGQGMDMFRQFGREEFVTVVALASDRTLKVALKSVVHVRLSRLKTITSFQKVKFITPRSVQPSMESPPNNMVPIRCPCESASGLVGKILWRGS